MNEMFIDWWSPLTTTGLVVVVVVCLSYVRLGFVCRGPTRSSLPGPKGWPIVGNALSIDRSAHVTFTEWAKKYGAVIGVKIGPMNVVVLNDLHSIESTFAKNAGITDRPVPGLLKAAFSNNGSLLWENGENWIKNRKFVLRYLYTFKQRQLPNLLDVESKQLCQTIKQHNGAAVDIFQSVNMAVSNILCALCFGHRFEYEDKKFGTLLSNLHELGKSVSGTTIGHFLPFLYYTPLYSDFRKLAMNLSNFIDGEIVQHMETFDAMNVGDLIDAFMKEEEVAQNMSKQRFVRRAIIDVFASGTDTTGNALIWAILYMTQYKDKQATVQREIDAVTNQLDLQTLRSHYKNLPYTRATLMEVLRHANISPLGLPRKLSKSTSIEGYSCRRGTWIFANLWAVHHDEKYWDAPNEFKPERFLSVDHQSVISSKAFMPFGFGKRFCVGEQIAMATMLVIFSRLLLEFNFSIPDGDPKPSLVGINGLTLSPMPFRVCATPR